MLGPDVLTYSIYRAHRDIHGEVTLAGSKSISNRVLIIRALCSGDFEISRLANARDTQLLDTLLVSTSELRDAGAAGTTFRFLTAYLALQPGKQTLTGTERMKQRPIGVLVEALRGLGASIEYLEKEGYPPLRLGTPDNFASDPRISIAANTSSQYISALLMIAPTLPHGLELNLEGHIVSRPYIEMTLGLMKYFGVAHQWEGNLIKIKPQAYEAKPFVVEADWSAASYYYGIAAFADQLDLQLNGLFADSFQGDAILPEMMETFGVQTTYNEQGVHLSKTHKKPPLTFDWDFIRCPDLAQTLFAVCGGLGIKGRFTGLVTLRIKETDRIAAMQQELTKFRIGLNALSPELSPETSKEYYGVQGKVEFVDEPVIETYEDHRMAMALAPLAMFGRIHIQEPMVVEKSYPDFWKDLQSLGFEVKPV